MSEKWHFDIYAGIRTTIHPGYTVKLILIWNFDKDLF